MVTLIFFDCEFTGLSGSALLISAGFIIQSGDQFYAELSDYDEDACNDFVKTTVLPLLSMHPILTADFLISLTDWLRNLGGEFLIIADSDWDQRILTKTFVSVGKTIRTTGDFRKLRTTSQMARSVICSTMKWQLISCAIQIRNHIMHWRMLVRSAAHTYEQSRDTRYRGSSNQLGFLQMKNRNTFMNPP